MDTVRREAIKEKILKAIDELQGKINRMEQDTAPIAPENSIGRVSRMDAIHNKSVTESALRTAKARLSKLKIALSKLEKPDFGICSICKQPIPEARLMFMPESTRCVRCADR